MRDKPCTKMTLGGKMEYRHILCNEESNPDVTDHDFNITIGNIHRLRSVGVKQASESIKLIRK